MDFQINSKNITILIADDEPTNRMIATLALKKEGYKLIEATNGIEAVNLAKQHTPDVILMDAIMPAMDGFKAIEEIKKIDELQNIPILMITALDSKEDKIKAFESGANDYLNKPFDMTELVLRVRSFVKMRCLYIKNLKARIDLNYNISNIQALRDKIEESKNPAGIFLKIRDFDNIIYLYGLDGSKVIVKDMISKIKDMCQIKDISIYTISEDRFVVFWDNENYSKFDIEEYVKNFILHINKESFGNQFFMSDIKINCAITTIKENFIQVGNLVLREAITQNKPYLIADNIYESMLQKVESTMKMIKYIDTAIQEDRIVPVYQAIYDVEKNGIYKYECLVRIQKEDGTLMSPFFFLDIAKQSEQYDIITRTMISKTFEYMKDKPYEFSINLSSIDIENPSLLDFLFKKLDEYDIHKRVIIELLEDEVINDFNQVLDFIEQIKKMGVRIAIDDYGSGYSNLERIFQFKPDFIKIDGSIIKGICEDSTKEAIAKSAVYLAKEIGIQTVGEFVFNEKVCKKCKKIGIDFLQGYYIREPKLETIN